MPFSCQQKMTCQQRMISEEKARRALLDDDLRAISAAPTLSSKYCCTGIAVIISQLKAVDTIVSAEGRRHESADARPA